MTFAGNSSVKEVVDWAITAWQQWQVAVERHANFYKLNITPFNNYNKKNQIVFQV